MLLLQVGLAVDVRQSVNRLLTCIQTTNTSQLVGY